MSIFRAAMLLSSSDILNSRPVISSFADCRAAFFSSCVLSHHAFLSVSISPSSSMRASIFLISSSTVSNGFSASSRASTRAALRECRDEAALRSRASARSRRAAEPTTRAPLRPLSCRSEGAPTLRVCSRRAPVVPVEVAATLPKASKAMSLLRIAMAWAIAVSSLVRSATRFSYCAAFSVQSSRSCSRKASASAFSASSASFRLFLLSRSSSLPESSVCTSPSRVSISPYSARRSAVIAL
mmetsp:Transcript_70121/g.182790  ORF Transcript_70121/g.182790 Transcript_70121/m.182790 type:complete len:241 (-) Transcript_70121:831-1553(-)